jgi:PAS domain S-box-containing protein
MLFPFFAWAALRFSPRASTLMVLLACLVGLGSTATGWGTFPLGGETRREQLIAVQGFFAVTSLTVMMLSATLAERNAAEKKTQKSEERFRALIENGADAITLLDAQGLVLYEGPTVEALTGYTAAERVGQSGIGNLHPEDAARVRQTYKQVLSKPGQVVTAEFRSFHKDGTLWWTEGSLTNLLDNPSVQAIVFNYRDITARKQAEQKLTQLFERLDLATTAAQLGIWDWDILKDELVWDEQMYKLYGLKSEDFEGAYAAWLQGVHPGDRDLCDQSIQQVLRGEREYDLEFRILWPNGAERVMKAYGHVTRTAEGAPLRMIGINYDITERKRAEEALRKSEEKFSKAFKASPEAITIASMADGRYLEVNEVFLKTTGFQRDEVLGHTSTELNVWADLEQRRQFLAELARNGSLRDFAVRYRMRTGEIRDFLVSSDIIELEGKQCSLNFILDVTERKLAEDALRESERQLRETQLIAGLGSYRFDFGLGQWESSPVLDAIFGIDETFERSVTGWAALIHPIDRQRMTDYFANEVIGQRQRFDQEYRIVRHQDGSARWVHGVGKLEFDAQDQLVAMLGTIQDITERKQAEEALRESEQKFRMLFENMTSGFALHEMIYDEQGRPCDYRYLEVNPAFEKLTGVPVSALVGKTVLEVLPNTEDYWIQTYARVAETGEPLAYDNYAKELGKHYDTWVFSPHPGQFAVVFNDITQRKQAELERDRLLLELERKNKELESIVYVASHDLRSPLVNIQGFGRNIQKYLDQVTGWLAETRTLDEFRAATQPIFTERFPRALQFIAAGSSKMDILIDGLLRVSRAGRVQLHPVQVEMRAMLQNILETMAFQIEKTGAQVEIQEPLDDCYGDRNQLNQVFSNLVDNALKYRAPDRPLRITLSSARKGGKITYMIADTGLGIAPENQDKIWELFRRLEEDASIPGEGLGLTLTRRIVERHGGNIWVESEPGVGSRFFIELPASAQ